MRGQTEIVGIVIIVLIVTLGLLFYVAWATNEELVGGGRDLYTSYSSNEVATSFAQSLLNTYVPACEASFEDVLKECGRGRAIRCNDPCGKLRNVTEEVLNDTLDVWNYPYNLTIELNNANISSYGSGDCARDTVGHAVPGVFLVPYFPAPGEARLEIGFCS